MLFLYLDFKHLVTLIGFLVYVYFFTRNEFFSLENKRKPLVWYAHLQSVDVQNEVEKSRGRNQRVRSVPAFHKTSIFVVVA